MSTRKPKYAAIAAAGLSIGMCVAMSPFAGAQDYTPPPPKWIPEGMEELFSGDGGGYESCDLPQTEDYTESCAEVAEVTYTALSGRKINPVTGEKNDVHKTAEIDAGKEYDVLQERWVAEGAGDAFANVKFVMYDKNNVRIDFVDGDGQSTMKDISTREDGSLDVESSRDLPTSKTGDIYVPMEARDGQGAQGPKVLVKYKDGSQEYAKLPVRVNNTKAAAHEPKVYQYGDDDKKDRTVAADITMMVGKVEVVEISNELGEGKSEPKSKTKQEDMPENGANIDRVYMFDEYRGNKITWAQIDEFRSPGEREDTKDIDGGTYKLRLHPGEADVGEHEIHLSFHYSDDTWRTVTLKVTVESHEVREATRKYGDLTIQAWDRQDVFLDGAELPEGTHYELPEKTPKWIHINRYSGMLTVAPQNANIDLKTYNIQSDARLPDGSRMSFPMSITVIQPYDDASGYKGNNGRSGLRHEAINAPNGSGSNSGGGGGFFGGIKDFFSGIFK